MPMPSEQSGSSAKQSPYLKGKVTLFGIHKLKEDNDEILHIVEVDLVNGVVDKVRVSDEYSALEEIDEDLYRKVSDIVWGGS